MQTQIANRNSQITQRPPNGRGTRHSAPSSRESRVMNPEPPRFIVTLTAQAGEHGLIRVPLAVTGKWVRGATTFAITREDLESIVRNFRGRQNGEINVDYDHASEMPEVAAGGPVPSAGRIVRLDAPEAAQGSGIRGQGLGENTNPQSLIPNPRFILYGWFEPTARARELLENREYRFISPAIEWGAKSKRTGKTQGTTLTSVALTNRPFLEELPQIRLSDPEFVPVHEEETGNWKLEIGNRKLEIGNSQIDNRQTTIDNQQAAHDRPLPTIHSPVSSFQFPVSDIQFPQEEEA